MKKDEKRTVTIIFIVALILAFEYSNYTTEKRHKYDIEKIEARLELANEKDSIEYK